MAWGFRTLLRGNPNSPSTQVPKGARDGTSQKRTPQVEELRAYVEGIAKNLVEKL
jgi:hypothetical protein